MFTNMKTKLKFIAAFLAITGLITVCWFIWFVKYIILAAVILFIGYKVTVFCINVRKKYVAFKARVKAKFTRGTK